MSGRYLMRQQMIHPVLVGALISVAASFAHAGDPPKPVKPADPSASAKMPVETVHALCIGVSDYSSHRKFNDLAAARTDAEIMHSVFREEYGYQSRLLLDSDATYERIMEEIDRLSGVGPEDAVIIFFAGHGHNVTKDDATYGFLVPYGSRVPDEVGEEARRLVAAKERALPGAVGDDRVAKKSQNDQRDGDPALDRVHGTMDQSPVADTDADVGVSLRDIENARSSTVYSPEWLSDRYVRIDIMRDRLLESDAKHVLMLFDSCFSGIALDLKQRPIYSRGVGGNDREDARHRLLSDGSRVVMTAGMAEQKVYENTATPDDIADNQYLKKAKAHGVFTRQVVLSLSGDELALTSSELFSSVYDNVTDWGEANSMHRMTPQRRAMGARGGDFVFVKSPDAKWLQIVGKLYAKEVGKVPAGGVDGRGQGAEKPKRKNIRKKDRIRLERAAMEAELAQKQPWLDMMIISQEVARTQGGEGRGSSSEHWRELIRRNERLAAQGDPTATAAMSLAYQHGIGVEKDSEHARVWAIESRDVGSFEGRMMLQLIQGMNAEEILAMASGVMQNQDIGDINSAMTMGFVASSAFDDERVGHIAALLLGGISAFGILTEEKPEQFAIRAIDARDEYMRRLDQGVGRNDNRQVELLQEWLNAANWLKDHAQGYEKSQGMYATLAPTISKRLTSALSAYQKRVRNGRTYQSEKDALAAADRYTDELVVLTLSEFVFNAQ